jgi:hypothetical protein
MWFPSPVEGTEVRLRISQVPNRAGFFYVVLHRINKIRSLKSTNKQPIDLVYDCIRHTADRCPSDGGLFAGYWGGWFFYACFGAVDPESFVPGVSDFGLRVVLLAVGRLFGVLR